MNFYKWLNNKGLSSKSSQSYSTAIYKTMPNWIEEIGIPNGLYEFYAYKYLLENSQIFNEKNIQGHNMYSAALNHFEGYLKDSEFTEFDQQAEFANLNSEQKKIVSIRIVQYKFRRNLFNLWDGCLISDCKIKSLLIASHVKPWSHSNNAERVDPFNGLLLTPNYDALFDKGFISFEMDGTILLSPLLSQNDVEFFQLPDKVKYQFSTQHREYLDYHREIIFKK